ncbi:glycosyl hydrolase 53 family protein [Turicibacter sanguinis]|uniref:glycosyl hydrolase 53 family protein n=1 Tax=Turicibacter sanguinis TaxID=154288 RepID=UPI00189BC98E|nr:glycosyl hydrolase 53 family protein [Turicibacter sanguinis]
MYLLNKSKKVMLAAICSTSIFGVTALAENDLVSNSSFNDALNNWQIEGDSTAASISNAWGYNDSSSLNYFSNQDYEVRTEQTITGLENGFYRLELYSSSSGGQEEHYVYANNGARTSIPVSDDFIKVILDFEVLNNEATIGIYSNGLPGTSSNYDEVSLQKKDTEYRMLKGGDLTMVNFIEDLGGEYFDEDGNARDVFHILAENGFNFARLRTHNNVGRDFLSQSSPRYYLPDGYQNTEDLLKSAKRAKDVGMAIEVTLNYSDWWPNAANQEIPADWREAIEGMSDKEAVDKLETLVYDYTKEVMQALADQGTTPEYISLGNEMQYGILYPYGNVVNFQNLARFLNAGYKAVKEVSTNTQVILHLDEAGDDDRYFYFFDECEKYGVNYDIIGSSYYPFWSEVTVEDVMPWFEMLGEKYQKKIVIMETGYKWYPVTADKKPGQLITNGPESHDASPQGQKEFLDELFNGIRNIENNWVIGDLYWDPVMINHEGVGWAMIRGAAEDGSQDMALNNVVSNTTLFDFEGKALPALKSFKDTSEGSTEGMISGIVYDEEGNILTDATVILTVGKEKVTRSTDKYGRFFLTNVESSKTSEVKVSKSGFKSVITAVDVLPSETTTIELSLETSSGIIPIVIGGIVLILAVLGTIFVQLKKKK